jgi:hypothetical protein
MGLIVGIGTIVLVALIQVLIVRVMVAAVLTNIAVLSNQNVTLVMTVKINTARPLRLVLQIHQRQPPPALMQIAPAPVVGIGAIA